MLTSDRLICPPTPDLKGVSVAPQPPEAVRHGLVPVFLGLRPHPPTSASVFTWPLPVSICSQGHQPLGLEPTLVQVDIISGSFTNCTFPRKVTF